MLSISMKNLSLIFWGLNWVLVCTLHREEYSSSFSVEDILERSGLGGVVVGAAGSGGLGEATVGGRDGGDGHE
ncbi:hypothetical protein MKW92_053321 [Papaver armeniacum]|nr:hypothetical protein MKW92_053321 [Papaver armeniacum]